MKIKKEYAILTIIILILSLYLYMRKTDLSNYELPQVASIGKDDISKIEISKNGMSLQLVKKWDAWLISPYDFPADKDKIKEVLDMVSDITLTALVSESKNYVRYDLDDKNKITVKAWVGDTLKREIDVGKTASSYKHTFVKLANDYRVYHARDNFRSKIDRTGVDFQQKTIISFNQDDIKEMTITSRGGNPIKIERSQDKVTGNEDKKLEKQQEPPVKDLWKSSSGEQVDGTKIKELLSHLSNLTCEKYINGKKKTDFTDPIFMIHIKGSQEYDLSIFEKTGKDGDNQPAICSASEYPFFLSKSIIENVVKKPQDLFQTTNKQETVPSNQGE